MANLQSLAENVLDPAREAYRQPVYVSSGYRCPSLNKAVGGAVTSQHTRGEAADLCTGDGRQGNLRLAAVIDANRVYDQLILEDTGRNDFAPAWVHVSCRRDTTLNRCQILRKIAGERHYSVVTCENLQGCLN